jgi:selenocysteine lyase/cysteine desulfurase
MERALKGWQSGTGNWIEDWDQPSDRCRSDFAALIGTSPANIAFIPAASVGAGVVAVSLRAGDEVVVPVDEFTSTLYPVLVAARRGAIVHEVGFEALAESIRPGTRLVAFSLVQMQTGKTADLRAICERASEVGAEVFVDATQSVPFVPIADLLPKIDYLVCAGYKHLLSPRGTAYFYVRADRWDSLEAHNANWRAADQPFNRYFGGPLSLSATAARFDVSRAWLPWLGASESLRLLSSWRDSDMFPAVRRLADRLAEGTGIPKPGSSLVCVPIDGAELARAALKEAGIKASVRGTSIRFAPHVYNTEADIDRAIEAIRPFLD